MFKRLSDYICQRVFDKAIRTGRYKEGGYMCASTINLYLIPITAIYARRCIRKYLNELSPGSYTLAHALYDVGLPNRSADRMAIYKDWKNRPYPNKVTINEQV